MHQLCSPEVRNDNLAKSPEKEKSRSNFKHGSTSKSAASKEITLTTIPFKSRETNDDIQNTEDTGLFEDVDTNDYMDAENYADEYENDAHSDVKDVKPYSQYRQLVRRCKECDVSFSEKSEFLDHMVSVHDKIVHQCELCDHNTIYISDLRKHVEQVHDKKKYPCTDCDYVANSASNLRVHTRSKHEGIKYPCKFCEMELSSRTSWRRHIDKIHGDEILQESELE